LGEIARGKHPVIGMRAAADLHPISQVRRMRRRFNEPLFCRWQRNPWDDP
jgi:hypothetical protein